MRGDSISPLAFIAMGFNRFNLGLFNSGTYTPFICDLEDVTRDVMALVTTTIPHTFVVGNEVQFFIPQQWGMRQLNNKKGIVQSIPQDDQIVVNINTLFFDTFVTPINPINPAQVLGIGDQNFGKFSPGGVVQEPITIPGAFLNQFP